MLKRDKCYILFGLILILLLTGCKELIDPSIVPSIVPSTDDGAVVTLPTLADDQLMATDKSVGFISAIEEQVVNNEQLAQGSDVIYEGVTGTVEQITASPTVQALAAAVEQPSKIIVVKFPDGGKVAGTVTISVYGDDTWSMDGGIEFEVLDNMEAGTPLDRKIPIEYEGTRFGKDGDIRSGSIIVKSRDGGEDREISTQALGPWNKLVKFLKKINTAMAKLDENNYAALYDLSSLDFVLTLKDGDGSLESFGMSDKNEYYNRKAEITDGFAAAPDGSWEEERRIDVRMYIPPNNGLAAYDGLALDLNTSTIVNMKYTKDSTENASEEKHVSEISSIWDGTAAADGVEIEFKQLAMSYIYTYGYSAESSAQRRFSGSFIIDGVEMKISDIAFDRLSQLFKSAMEQLDSNVEIDMPESSDIAVEWRQSHEDNYGAVDNIPAGHTSLVFNDRVWLLGGIGTLHSGDKKVYSGYRDSVLSSTDGVKWNIEVDDAPWAARLNHSSVLFSVDGEERMWIFGGHTVDDNDAVHPLNDVWSSADGRNWRKESPESGDGTDDSDIWAPRYGHSTVVYDGAIWLFGGSDSIDDSSDEVGVFNDVWRSDDGKVWTKVMDSAEWSGRLAASAAVFTVDNVEKIFLIGGFDIRYDEVYEEYGRDSFNDIWSYTAGASSWTQEVTEAPWVPDFGKVALVNDGRLWLIAGQTGGIWFTVNGRDWSSSESNADRIGSSDYFSIQRVATSAVIYNGEIWLVGGVNSDAGDVTFFQDVLIGKFKSN